MLELAMDKKSGKIVATKAKQAESLQTKPQAKKVTTMNEVTQQTPEEIAAQKAAEKQAKAEAAAVAKAERESAKAAAKAEKDAAVAAAKAEKEAAKAAKAAEKEAGKEPVIEQNGVKQPVNGTKALDIWRLANEISAQKQSPVALKELTDAAVAQGHSGSTVFGEYSKWRKFHGIAGRIEDPVKAAERSAKAEATAAKKAEREAAKASRVEQNGVKRPSAGTKTGFVWNTADQLSAQKGSVVSLSELKSSLDPAEYNDHTVQTQYASWRKFHGIAGRIVNPQSSMKSLDKLQAQLAKAEDRLLKAFDAVNTLKVKISELTPAQ